MGSGSLTLGGNSTVSGNVQIQGGSFSIGSASIKGDLQITNVPNGGAPGVVCGASVSGKLQFQGNAIPRSNRSRLVFG
jgi:autotransporter-associated beta strand protein